MSKAIKVFVTRVITHSAVKRMRDAGLIVEEWKERRGLSQDELIEKCKDVDILVNVGAAKLDATFLNACKHLKLIALHAVGYDNVDIAAATAAGIPIGNTPGVVSRATASTAFMLMQMAARKALFHHRRIAAGEWKFFDPIANLGIDLYGKTLGVFGLGNIGEEMARLSKDAFGMKILYHNRNRTVEAEERLEAQYCSFDELLKRSDVISVHASLNDDNAGVFNYSTFSKMKPEAIFVNTARGGLHNEQELIRALQEGKLGAAALDVTNPEPMSPENVLLTMPNAIVLPHIGTSTIETREEMVRLIADNVLAAAQGEAIPYVVNPEVYKC